jgi:hypothetical protein
MDLVSAALLSLFAAAAAGGAIGFGIGRFTRFEIGLGVGLVLFGAVALYFAGRCFLEYRAFAYAGPYAAWGEVIAIEDRPVNASGSVTSPVPVVRFSAADGSTHVIRGPASGSMAVGEHVNVIVDPLDPQRSRASQVKELRGGAIALLLFGTFPMSFGAWLLLTERGGPARTGRGQRGASARAQARPAAAPIAPAGAQRARGPAIMLLNAALVCAILWIGAAPGDLQQRFVEGFGAVAAVFVGYALWGWYVRADAAWRGGMIVLALNFGVWALALALLR